MEEGYEGRLKRKDWGLVGARVDSYAGLVFGTLQPGRAHTGRVPRRLPVLPRPLPQAGLGRQSRCTVRPTTGSPKPTGRSAPRTSPAMVTTPRSPTSSASTSATSPHQARHTARAGLRSIPGKGHGIGLGTQPGLPPFGGFPDDLTEEMRRSLSPEQVEVFSNTRTAVGTVFPNLSFLMQPFSLVPGEPGVRFVTMRLYHPIGPGKTEMYSWCLVPKDASEEYKEAAYQAYTLAFAQAGTFEQDDFENWTKVTRIGQVHGSARHRIPVHHGHGEQTGPRLPRTRPRRQALRQRHQLPEPVDPVGGLPGWVRPDHDRTQRR